MRHSAAIHITRFFINRTLVFVVRAAAAKTGHQEKDHETYLSNAVHLIAAHDYAFSVQRCNEPTNPSASYDCQPHSHAVSTGNKR